MVIAAVHKEMNITLVKRNWTRYQLYINWIETKRHIYTDNGKKN